MNPPTSAERGPGPAGRRERNTVPLGPGTSREAKQRAAVILEVLAGVRAPAQAAEALGLSLPRYYQREARGLRGLLGAGAARPRGRQPDPAGEAAGLRRDNERRRRELARQQSLVRLAQRAVGLPPPAPPKGPGKKARQRRRAARALTRAARLRQEAEAGTGDTGMSPTAP